MLNYISRKIFGTHSDKKLKKYRKFIDQINQNEETFANFTEAECKAKTEEFKQRLAVGAELDSLIPEAFALVRKAAVDTLGERHYDVQLLGGLALHDGQIAEMKTGEGKTLTSTLPVYLNALTGKGVHVVTVNDYLTRRDAEWMGQIYSYLGLTVGLIQHNMNDEQRREAYLKDITYGTNNEFGFDFLRDNMKFELSDYVQREHNYAIVDEVDSILIDEARTPLIISGPTSDTTDLYIKADSVMHGLEREIRVCDNPEEELVAKMKNIEISKVKSELKLMEDTDVIVEGDYTLDEKSKNTVLSERGVQKMEERLQDVLKTPNLYDFENIELLHHVNQALKARYVFKRDVDYVVQNGKVIIVDEFTGRLMDGRRFSDGLHQALEAKERVQIEKENQTLASITFQNYFRKYAKLGGMTGTAETEEAEFAKIYGLGVVVIPTNKPLIRKDHPDVIYKTQEAKIKAIINQIVELHAKKQPILVGTASIESSEFLSAHLKKKKVPHTVLNAKYHEKEAEIVAAAGNPGAVTIATNMAGRGTDIKLSQEVLDNGGLFILGTDRHESRRIDNQLRGRAGRQGDIGASRFFLSLEDDLLRIFGGERIAKIMSKLNIDEDEAIEHVLISRSIENAQKKVEGHHFDIRKHLLEYDDVMNRQREIIYKQRREILSDEVTGVLNDMAGDLVDELVDSYCNESDVDNWDYEGLQGELKNTFKMILPKTEENEKEDSEIIRAKVSKELEKLFKSRAEEFGPYQKLVERQILLEVTDTMWKDHLLSLDHLKEGVGLRGYAQKNPLNEYKMEAFKMFSDLMVRIAKEAVTYYFQIAVVHEPLPEVQRQPQEMELIHGESETPEEPLKRSPVRKTVNIRRNDPCPCGSGKKYKNCHMKADMAANAHHATSFEENEEN